MNRQPGDHYAAGDEPLTDPPLPTVTLTIGTADLIRLIGIMKHLTGDERFYLTRPELATLDRFATTVDQIVDQMPDRFDEAARRIALELFAGRGIGGEL